MKICSGRDILYYALALIKIILVTFFPVGNAGTWNSDDVRHIRAVYLRLARDAPTENAPAVQTAAG